MRRAQVRCGGRTDGGSVGRLERIVDASHRLVRRAAADEPSTEAVNRDKTTLPRSRASVRPSVRHTARIAFIAVPYITPTRCAYKNNPLEKILYLRDCSKIFNETYSFYSGGFWPYVQHFSLQYLVSFKNYNNLNLKLHF